MKKSLFRFLMTIVFVSSVSTTFASTVDTIKTFSKSMNKVIKAVVILPDVYEKSSGLPVLYLLNGYAGNYSDYVKNAPEVKSFADKYQMMIVCPDGNYDTWYFDSPIDTHMRYETYISTELIEWIDKNYKTIKKSAGRAICGLSMGGHGALYLAVKHQDVFGAAGSMSGAVDIRPFSNNWNLAKRLGDYAKHRKRWDENTVTELLPLLKNTQLKLIIDCGTDDFFYKVNLALHQKLLIKKIPHDFITRPGGHTWGYWNNSLDYQVLFMSNFFKGVHK